MVARETRYAVSYAPTRIKVITGAYLDRLIKRKWKKEGALKVKPVKIPPELEQLGVTIHDALDVAKDLNSSNKVETEPVKKVPEISYDSSPNFYLFNEKIETTETEDQALCLTKTVLNKGLPSKLQALVSLEKIPNQKKLVQRCITQALIKDSQMVKLPRRPDPEKPWYGLPREYGIDLDRRRIHLAQKLSHLCDMACGKYPESYACQRILNPFSETIIKRGKDIIVFQMLGDVLYSSPKPLKPFASAEEVKATNDIPLPDIYPVKPTLDLEKHEVSPAKQTDDVHIIDSKYLTPSYIHTLHIVHKGVENWEKAQLLSRAINGSFTYAANEAQRLYGKEVKELPNPVSVQCVYSDLTDLGFLAYQLNTLDFSSDKGIKNQAWVEEPEPLFEHEESAITLWEILGIKNYDDKIFAKLLAFYLNGIHPSVM